MGPEIHDPDMAPESGRKGGALAARTPGMFRYGGEFLTRAEAGEIAYLSRASWPAIWAGFFISMVVYLLLNVLGAALGMAWTQIDTVTPGTFTTAAGIWLIAATLIVFYVGGCVTSSMSALPGKTTGFMNGILYGCFSFVMLTVLSITPMLAILPTVVGVWAQGGVVAVEGPASPMLAWWTFFAILFSLLAAGVGGMTGARPMPVDPLESGAETA
jgi:hypothetical protein